MQSADYERIKTKIGEVFEENSDFLKAIPIDVFGLARKMGFKLITASELIKKGDSKVEMFHELNKTKTIYGYSLFDTKNMEYVIYYDDVNAGTNKQRFSVAHEIGHIVLGHIDEGIEDSEKAEKEADYFAGYLLCPECLATNEEIFDYFEKYFYEMPNVFDIALDTAMIKLRHFRNRNSIIYQEKLDYEETIMKCIEKAVLIKIRD